MMDKDFLKSFYMFLDSATSQQLTDRKHEIEILIEKRLTTPEALGDAKFLLRRIDEEFMSRQEVEMILVRQKNEA